MYGCTVQYILYERKCNAKRVAYGKNTFTPHCNISMFCRLPIKRWTNPQGSQIFCHRLVRKKFWARQMSVYISIFKMLYFESSLYIAAFIFLVQILRFYSTYMY